MIADEGNGTTLLSQNELDSVLDNINNLIETGEEGNLNLIDEIQNAILDSGKLELSAWKSLRERLREIENLVPHIDLIIKLKEKQERLAHLLD